MWMYNQYAIVPQQYDFKSFRRTVEQYTRSQRLRL